MDVENVQNAVFVTYGIKPQVTINVGGPLIAATEGMEKRIEAPAFFSGSSAFVPALFCYLIRVTFVRGQWSSLISNDPRGSVVPSAEKKYLLKRSAALEGADKYL